MHPAFMSHIVWYSENMKEKNNKNSSILFQTEQKYDFDAEADTVCIWWNFDACNVNQWDLLSNSAAETDIKLCK